MGRFFFFYSFLCFVLLISECFSSSFDHHLCSPTEASALLQFKQSFQNMSEEYFSFLCDGASFPKTESWNESRDCCSWDGVTCDLLNGHVIGLDLSCSQLFGTFHPNSSLFQLHHLHTLNLANNDFNWSSIPHNIGRLTNLRHLNLSHSSFYGKIPTEISYLSNLVSLHLSSTFYDYGLQLDERTFEAMLHNFTNLELLALPLGDISSLIPVSIHPNSSLFKLHHLHTLNLHNSYFNPSSSIPHNIGRLRNLRHLKLSGFDGKIPTEISYLNNLVSLDLSPPYEYELQLDERTFEAMLQNFTNLEILSLSEVNISSPNISSSLTELDISYTGISGSIPDSIGTLKSLNILSLHRCQFSGSIPDSIGNLTQITELILSFNHFTGHIPSTISKLKHLTCLDLSSNSFSGEILDVFSNLQKLSYLDLSSNSFSGEIPDVFSNLQELYYLDLSSNSFSGEIPDVFSNLQELRYLRLSENSFIGPFPASILNLTHLEYLDMSSNSLSGPLPSNPSMLQNVLSLDLSYNSLNGTIPSWVFSLPLLPSLSLQHNRFRGLADEVIKTNPTLKEVHLSNNQLSGSFPQSLVNLTNLETLGISSNNITVDEGMNITFLSLSSLFLSSCQLKDFPHFLRNVKTLVYLDISNNKIRGQIPDWFSGMRWDSLQFLNLSHNSLTGHLPQFRYHNLQYLDLKFNSLQGPLPLSICNMSSLILLDLSHNYFSDSVPHCLGSVASLMVLDLRRNDFTGSLPPLCVHSTSLSTIVINGNRFEGPVPVSLLKCNGLLVLDMGNNAINDTFPAWLGILQELQWLTSCKSFWKLQGNDQLDGEDTGNIKYMESALYSPFVTSYEDSVSLVIKGQDIELERISTIMTTIDLSRNHFEGVIPKTLKDLRSLWLLNLSHNNLRGDIPMKLGQLSMLEALDLSWNRLTGKIPQELTRINFLAFLNLSQNHLVGPIPQGRQFNTFENDSYGGNLDLCGVPLTKKCGTGDSSHVPQQLESEEEGESYFFSGFTWESVVIGYSFGLVVGTVMWSLMFKYRKPKWFVEFFDGLMPHKRRRPKKRAQRRRT
ncbi:hypothetical protein MTR67_053552 [Solanum verrucosum]|uniref:Leucine-rich repeat-containing N-terminal plant-type domain-containing protein n=1 Tax=Solanum verrucosum TaxID=315347 RepID=A0AAF1A0X7_SOLVR|nr:hypothetical protein MTR67_053552 [Solanum verrucosum]